MCLYDTGYNQEHWERETAELPGSLYAKLTPTHHSASAAKQLSRLGVRAEEVEFIFISHFHGDHISGLCDFPNARFVYFDSCYNAVRCKTGFTALLNGFLPGFLPSDFEARSVILPDFDPFDGDQTSSKCFNKVKGFTGIITLDQDNFAPFRYGLDVCKILGIDKDCTDKVNSFAPLIAVPLPGHFPGQLGLFINTFTSEEARKGVWCQAPSVFLVGDAVWHSASYREQRFPWRITALLAHHSWIKYERTLKRIRCFAERNPACLVVPTHCRVSGLQ